MKRLVTLASGQFGDMSLDALCALAKEMGYEGVELATHAHFDVQMALHEPGYIQEVRNTLNHYGLQCQAISAHLTGQCVCDTWMSVLMVLHLPLLQAIPRGFVPGQSKR